MSRCKIIPEIINGFKVLDACGQRKKFAKLECKVCFSHFIGRISKMHIRKSCGCLESACRPLPQEINGFKIIKDLGLKVYKNNKKNRKERCLIALCKKCNQEFESTPPHLRRNNFGCGAKCSLGKGGTKRLAKIRGSMIARCNNRQHVSYINYSSNKIKVCDDWLNNSSSFYKWAKENGYDDSLTLDRIDNSKGYSPENCRWSTKDIQSQNSSQAKLNIQKVKEILILTKTMRQDDVAKIYNVTPSTISGIVRGIRWKNVPRDINLCI